MRHRLRSWVCFMRMRCYASFAVLCWIFKIDSLSFIALRLMTVCVLSLALTHTSSVHAAKQLTSQVSPSFANSCAISSGSLSCTTSM